MTIVEAISHPKAQKPAPDTSLSDMHIPLCGTPEAFSPQRCRTFPHYQHYVTADGVVRLTPGCAFDVFDDLTQLTVIETGQVMNSNPRRLL